MFLWPTLPLFTHCTHSSLCETKVGSHRTRPRHRHLHKVRGTVGRTTHHHFLPRFSVMFFFSSSLLSLPFFFLSSLFLLRASAFWVFSSSFLGLFFFFSWIFVHSTLLIICPQISTSVIRLGCSELSPSSKNLVCRRPNLDSASLNPLTIMSDSIEDDAPSQFLWQSCVVLALFLLLQLEHTIQNQRLQWWLVFPDDSCFFSMPSLLFSSAASLINTWSISHQRLSRAHSVAMNALLLITGTPSTNKVCMTSTSCHLSPSCCLLAQYWSQFDF